MKKFSFPIIITLLIAFIQVPVYSQKKTSPSGKITSDHLESYLSFLASPLLKGRMNGDEGLEIASQYLASQAKLIGLKPANGSSYFQPYPVTKKTMNKDKTIAQVISSNNDTVSIKAPMFQLVPTGPSDFVLEGEVVFAGYGIRSDKYKYNDFDSLNIGGKIVLIMDRAPMSEDGLTCQFEEPKWNKTMSFQMKLQPLIFSKPKAVLIVADPKSGHRSIAEASPGFTAYLDTKVTLKGGKEDKMNSLMAMMPKIIFVDRSLADALLEGSGHTLEELQRNIDSTFKPQSFEIKDKKLKITEVSVSEDKTLNNVAAYIEGSDPVLKNEIIVFSGHYDHIGILDNEVNPGADDDASGCAAILSIAEAFQNLNKKPLRSVLFLWVSGEEIGLFGSETYVNNPLFPLSNTLVDLNMDMIGRVKEPADSTDETPMTGPDKVFVITGGQSKELRSIADDIDKKSPLDFDYSLSGRDHPLSLFSRSDHYNFVEKDIPVLFFTTGLHSDYHSPRDVVEKIDFEKMELVTRTVFDIGYSIANQKTRMVVDNPFSSWGKSK